MEKIYPIPEALSKSPWEIVGGVNNSVRLPTQGKLVVPLSADVHDIVQRTHEMAHVRWSPKDGKEIPPELNPVILAAVEDVRVNARAGLAKVDLSAGYHPELVDFTLRRLEETGDKDGALLFALSIQGVGPSALQKKAVDLAEKLEPGNAAIVERLTREAGGAPSFEHFTLKWSKWLQERVTKREEREEKKKKLERERMDSRRHSAKEAMEEFDEMAVKSLKVAKDRIEPVTSRWVDDKVPWGVMLTQRVALPNRMPGRFGRQHRASDTGVALGYPQRLWQDGRVFTRRLRGYGGAVLVDCSGSMHLTPNQVFSILKAAPGATIALYGGHGRTGTLRIVAHKGLVADVEDLNSPGGQNVIDYPALQWLTKQSEPRIWVTDLYVTGINDGTGGQNITECVELAELHRVMAVPNPIEATRMFEKIRRRAIGVAA